MRYQVDHLTRVDYRTLVRMARFNLRLSPIAWPGQTIEQFSLEIDPPPVMQETRPGPYPFNLTRIEMEQPMTRLSIRARFIATADDLTLDLAAPEQTIGAVADAALEEDVLGGFAPVHYLYPSPLLPGDDPIGDWARPHLPAETPALASGLALARHIQQNFVYDGSATEADTPVAEAFAIRRGVCQDFAHILIEALRSVGLPAAYLSGYLRTVPPPGKPRLVGVDAMHAWVGLWCGAQRGWVGLDPTNGCIAGSGHIVTAMGRDYADVAPIDGVVLGGGKQTIDTAVDVMPIG